MSVDLEKCLTIFGKLEQQQNFFLVDTNADDEELEALINALPPEFLDRFINLMGNALSKKIPRLPPREK